VQAPSQPVDSTPSPGPLRRQARSRITLWLRLAIVAPLLNGALVIGTGILVTLDERAHPPIGEFVEVDERRLHLVRAGPPHEAAGTGRATLLLLHGGGTSLLDLSGSLMPALSALGHPVIAIDRPGHGYSEAHPGDVRPDAQARLLQGALDALGIDEAVWIGHSRAAAVVLAALLATDAPRPTAGVLLAGVTQPSNRPVAAHHRLLQAQLLGPWFAWTAIEYAGRLAMPSVVDAAFAPESPPPDYVTRTGLNLSLRPMAALHDARERRAVQRWLEASMPDYARIDRPLIALHGQADALVPQPRHRTALSESVATLSAITLPGAGHGLVHTRTDAVATAIVKALDAIERAGRDRDRDRASR